MHAEIVYFSDSHGQHNKLKIPTCDILICGGDFTLNGRQSEVLDFFKWFDRQPSLYKIVVAGNHDICFDKKLQPAVYGTIRQLRPSWLEQLLTEYMNPLNHSWYLEGNSCEVWNLRIWGSPYTVNMRNSQSAFKLDNAVEEDILYSSIPDGTDIIVSHGPAHNRLDEVMALPDNIHLGSNVLLSNIHRVKPTYVFSGHAHDDYGYMLDPQEDIKTMYYNGSLTNESGYLAHTPWYINLPL